MLPIRNFCIGIHQSNKKNQFACQIHIRVVYYHYRDPIKLKIAYLLINLSASINFDEDETDSSLIPIDWTPTNGYINETIRKMALPRPAPGETFCCGIFKIFIQIHDFVRSWKSSGIICYTECQRIGLFLFIHRKCWFQNSTS